MSDPNDLTRQGDFLERTLTRHLDRNVGNDLAGLLSNALNGYPDDDVDEVEETFVREPAIDPMQGSGNIRSLIRVDDLEHHLRQAVGL